MVSPFTLNLYGEGIIMLTKLHKSQYFASRISVASTDKTNIKK